jgi:hypothetical protein
MREWSKLLATILQSDETRVFISSFRGNRLLSGELMHPALCNRIGSRLRARFTVQLG